MKQLFLNSNWFKKSKPIESELKPYSFVIKSGNNVLSVLEMETIKQMIKLKSNNEAVIYRNNNIVISVRKDGL